jgi:lysyl-tRNA synthetase class 1
MTQTDLITAAQVSKSWPFEEARKLVKRYPGGKKDADGKLVPVLFETGYGPSGLPHIGTFQEVLRTTLVRRAYEVLTGATPPASSPFPTTWTGCARCPTMSRTRTC